MMHNSPYKPVPPPKPLSGMAPPYRIPPPFSVPGTPGGHERHHIDPSVHDPVSANGQNGYIPMVGPAPTVIAHQEYDHSREHYHTHSSKFPIEKNIELIDQDKETLEDSRFRSKAPLANDAQRFPVARSSWRGTVFPNDSAIRAPAPAWPRDAHPDGHQGYWELSRMRAPFPHANGNSPRQQHMGVGHGPRSLVYHPPNLPVRQPPAHYYDMQRQPHQPNPNSRYRGDERDPLMSSALNRSSMNGPAGFDNPALDGGEETPKPDPDRDAATSGEPAETEPELKKKSGKAKEFAEKKYSKLKGMITSKFGPSSSSGLRNNTANATEKKQETAVAAAANSEQQAQNDENKAISAAENQFQSQTPNMNSRMPYHQYSQDQVHGGQTTPKRSPYPSRSHGDLTGIGDARTPPIYSRHSAVIPQHPAAGLGPRVLPPTPNFRPNTAIESPYGASGYDLYSRPIHAPFRPPLLPKQQQQPSSLKDLPTAGDLINRSRDAVKSQTRVGEQQPLSLPGMVVPPASDQQNVGSARIGRRVNANRRAGVVLDSDDDDEDVTGEGSRSHYQGDSRDSNQNSQKRGPVASNRRPGVGQESGSCFNTSQESSDGATAIEQRRTSSETLAADGCEADGNQREAEGRPSSWNADPAPPPLPSEPPPTKTPPPPPALKPDGTPEKPERQDLARPRHPFMSGSANQIMPSPGEKKKRPGVAHDANPGGMRPEFLHFSKTSVSYAGGLNFSGRLDPAARPAADGDASSTTTALESESFLDQDVSEESSNEEEVKYGRTRRHSAQQATQMRTQLEELEEIYSQVLRLLKGGKGGGGGQTGTMGVEELKAEFRKSQARMRRFGSVSSLPSSTTGPRYRIKDRRDDKQRRGKDSKTANSITKRFQRLESHIVTLARSVAQLSSEMRNQHLMIQEIESLRREVAEVAAWRGISMRPGPGTGGAGKHPAGLGLGNNVPWDTYRCSLPAFANPNRVKKLTKFFGTEPPLLRQFLRKLGYEKYAALFENEKIGMMELPCLSEGRLEKLGIPLGPRVRILQEAQTSFGNDKYNIYIV